MNKCPVYFVGLASVFSDVATTWIGSRYPEIEESNPLANPFFEVATVLGGQAAILHMGEKLKVNPKLTVVLALVPPIVPFAAAANNIIHIAIAHAKEYPFEECPFLYPEKQKRRGVA